MKMLYRLFVTLIVTTAFFSCKKTTEPIDPTVPNPSVPPVSQVFLKDIVIPNLPSPYYHFEYNIAGQVSFASFASGFNQYQIKYAGGKITEIDNTIIVNKDRLQYTYDNQGRVSTITYADEAGAIYTRLDLTFNGQQLIKVERQKKLGNLFVMDRILTMSYYADGNLQDITYHYLAVAGQQPESTYTDRFEQYDNKINVDGFGLLHNEFFDHLVLLPEAPLQKNNPGKERRTGDASNYVVDYTYTYDSKDRPLSKIGDLVFTTGSDAGKRFETHSFFSYY
jgi:hypothetical protein